MYAHDDPSLRQLLYSPEYSGEPRSLNDAKDVLLILGASSVAFVILFVLFIKIMERRNLEK